ncbi:MAG: potassium transporter KtrB, partial [Clostridia bacterium]|nr:potassium transporter KtrB [Clostridia bacterium]
AFCNAGIDIIAENSLCNYALNPIINIVTCSLIILGGIGYIVWWDVLRVLKKARTKKVRFFRDLTLHSKIAITVTLILVFVGAALIFAFEYNNPQTIKDYTLLQKMEVSLFQSVTTRTAGFATVPQENLTNSSAIVCLLLMFIGGSPVGTAGGIKTVTFAVIIVAAIASIRNKEDTEVFGRQLTKQAVSKAVAVTCMSFIIMFASTVLLSAVTDANALDIVYETVSATATVGLTRNLTASLGSIGKVIIIITMYLGRVGPISLAVAFKGNKDNQNIVRNPIEEISVG